MEELRFIVEPDDAGTRIDKCIALKLGKGYSRTFVKFLIEKGLVRVGGRSVKPRYIAHQGDEVFLELPPPEIGGVDPEDIPLKIIYEDDWIIVVDKPAGMVVHPGAGNRKGTLVNALLFHCGNLPDTGNGLRPGLAHRLDKDTSGILVVAKNERALRSLAKQFQKRAVKKSYLTVVNGRVEMDNGVVDLPVARHSLDRKKMSVEYARGKEARTVYHVLRRFRKFTLLRVEPETGRTHQIRVHMKHLGYPVVGDAKYGGSRDMERQALHAETLIFSHPHTGERMEFTSSMPEDMRELLEKEKNK
ncbi:MAG: RluA family pseudouridine synthase, partial [Candidatus Omnitrophota bacterium]|nr:RluA family pseudouridine synthase [Candidatus Omnitrophota bacterium]